ncbi:MAG: hypothetical protein MZW92_18880 [Comamonadaceae bacterium]|nr:hypothetical protein [Comamonadaceae bacterium]
MSEVYEIAKAGGKHSGLIRRFKDDTDYAIRKSVQSLRRQVELHAAYIADPFLKVDRSIGELAMKRLVELKWPKEIARLKEEVEVLESLLLMERRNG